MATITADEAYWLEHRWPDIKRAVLTIAQPLSHDVVEDIIATGEPTELAWSRFVRKTAAALDRKRAACAEGARSGGRGSRSQMYAIAISLLGIAEPMRKELVGARPRLSGPGRDGVVYSCLRSGLMKMRQEMTAEIGNRAKTWSLLDRISKEVWSDQVARGHVRDGDSRCSEIHYGAVVQRIREKRTGDHNLPKDADGVRGLFGEFYELFDDYREEDIEPEDISLLPDYARVRGFLEQCIGGLTGLTAEVFAFSRKVQTSIIDMTQTAFCQRLGIDRFKFNREERRANEQLEACVRDKLIPRAAEAGS